MKAKLVRHLHHQRCNAKEIADYLQMDLYRVRWLLKHDGFWPRRQRCDPWQQPWTQFMAQARYLPLWNQ